MKIIMPEGGTVDSSTGLYGCVEGESCTINIDHPYFAEAFTAIPKAGFEFSHWEKKEGGFCGDHSGACILLTTFFPDYPDWFEFLKPEYIFTMSPVFTEDGRATVPPRSDWTLASLHQNINYLVYGSTSNQVRQSLNGDDNPLDYRVDLGFKPQGLSQWRYVYRYWYEYRDNNLNCIVTRGEIEFRFNTTIPKLDNLKEKSEYLQSRWSAYHDALLEHEANHQRIFRKLVTRLPQEFKKVGKQPCNILAAAMQQAAKNAWVPIQNESDAYDVETNYGRYEIPSL